MADCICWNCGRCWRMLLQDVDRAICHLDQTLGTIGPNEAPCSVIFRRWFNWWLVGVFLLHILSMHLVSSCDTLICRLDLCTWRTGSCNIFFKRCFRSWWFEQDWLIISNMVSGMQTCFGAWCCVPIRQPPTGFLLRTQSAALYGTEISTSIELVRAFY